MNYSTLIMNPFTKSLLVSNFEYSVFRFSLKSCVYWSTISSAAFVELNWKKVVTLNTDCDNEILCILSNNSVIAFDNEGCI